MLHDLILQDFLVKFHFSAQCIMAEYFEKKIHQMPLHGNYQVQCFHKTHMNLPLISLKYIFGEIKKKSISLQYTVYNGGRFLKKIRKMPLHGNIFISYFDKNSHESFFLLPGLILQDFFLEISF